jgi:hypothetical protein
VTSACGHVGTFCMKFQYTIDTYSHVLVSYQATSYHAPQPRSMARCVYAEYHATCSSTGHPEGRTARLRRYVWGEGPTSAGGGPAGEVAPLRAGRRAGWRERRTGGEAAAAVAAAAATCRCRCQCRLPLPLLNAVAACCCFLSLPLPPSLAAAAASLNTSDNFIVKYSKLLRGQ